MKKVFLALVVMAVVGLVPAMAEQNTYFKPGSLIAQVGFGWGWGAGLEGGADLSLGQWAPAPAFPLDYGVGARVGFNTGFLDYGSGIGVEAYGTVHYSWKALKTGNDFVDKLESYTGVGIQFQTNNPDSPLGIASAGGTSYYIDDKLAIDLGYYSVVGYTLGVTYKLN